MKQDDYEKLWGKKTMQQALQDAIAKAHTGYSYAKLVSMVQDEENDDGLEADEVKDVDKLTNLIGHMFEYYGVKRLGEGFDKLEMASQMYIVGGIVHRFTAGLPEGAGFAEVKMENSDWQALLVRKGSGYQPEVDALIKATEE